ncbi:30S ribosomal protein S6 alpha, chloroplastic isoform X1 [Dioscorea cayenensis subsp. rotundata]|uniref:30S ribosomal protein S6 alpha, chloroplastic isoform X1 n=1 Tax=Dioscorea cayennensis subsp. rotundata TaxID=55577 RepID=A0AB40CV35_DIOCR|nr:30S ribosomal protein S6 alpha, chloroplastic isoform X1 [Dioscorea cayenensis subsp. rotundata]
MAYLATTLASSPSSSIRSSSSSFLSFISAHRLLRPLTKTGDLPTRSFSVRSQTLDFSGSFFEGGREDEGADSSMGSSAAAVVALEDKEEPQCPPGLRQYETMAVLRPDMTEDERLAFTQRYEEKCSSELMIYLAYSLMKLLVAGGGMYVEVFNRGVIPLAYSIKKKNKAGESNTYLDGIYLLFTYFTKPESLSVLEFSLNADDDVIRSSSFKIRKRKY